MNEGADVGGGAGPADAVRLALTRTLAAETARVDYALDLEWKVPTFPEPEHRHPLREAVGTVGKTVLKTVGKGIWRLLTRRRDLGHQTAEGFIDFAGRRFMMDYGSYAAVRIGDQEWSGRSGRRLDTLLLQSPRVGSPLWMVDLLGGIISAEECAASDCQRWRCYSVSTSAADAAAIVPGEIPTPAQDRFENLFSLPLKVWLDDNGYLRRVHSSQEHQLDSVTLHDFGVDIDDLDWTRLPDFHTSPR